MKDKFGKEIFSIKGKLDKGEKVGLFKKWPYYLTVFEKGISIRAQKLNAEIHIDDIIHVFRKDNILGKEEWRTLAMYYRRKGVVRILTLCDDNFPNIIEKMYELYENQWKIYSKNYSETVKWLLACTANVKFIWERPENCFGFPYESVSDIEEERATLERDWGIRNKSSLIKMCESLNSGTNARNCHSFYANSNNDETIEELLKVKEQIIKNDYISIWAYDLWRIIFVSELGYNCGYFSYEEALEWCLKAGISIQAMFDSWDDFYENYLLGYCFWSEQDVDLKHSDANKRKVMYEEIKKLPNSPWNIPWNTELKRQW